jgi:threonine/homoserine/homoserine lactone efflux protein
MDASLLTFLGISAAVIATPGPDTVLTVRNTLVGGRRAGVLTALGVSAGQIVWAVATSLGLVAVLLASEPVFQAVKLLGAGYLVYLGAQSVLAALRSAPRAHRPGVRGEPRLRAGSAFRQGLLNNLGNPKMAVFFASVFPQFAPRGSDPVAALVGLGLVFAALTLLWLALYAVVVARAGAAARATAVRRAVDGVAGLSLVGLGAKVALEHR